MRVYSSWFPPRTADRERPPMLVREGFSVWGLLLGWLVLLRPGSWLCAALAGLVSIAIGVVARHVPGAWALVVGLHLAVAAFAPDWRRWELRLGGYAPGPILAGADRGQALLRLLDQNPDMVSRSA